MAETLRYPLEDSEDYKGTIVFKVVDEDAVREALLKDLQDIADAAAKNYADQQEAEALRSGIVGSATDRLEAVNKAIDHKSVDTATVTSIEQVEKDATLPTKNTSACPYISLFLPTAFQLQDAVTFENFELGTLGAAAETALQQGQSGIAAAGGTAYDAIKRITATENVTSLASPTASLITANVLSKFGATGAQAAGVVRSVTGVQVNPNTRALFKSVPLRAFSFTFKMIPTSRVEAEQIKAIVRHFRSELYPEGLSLSGINYGYKFPNRFIIRAQYRNREMAGLKFLPAFLTGVSTVYNDQGMGMHEDGNFSSTTITLNFTESKALMKQHIEADF